MEKPTSRNSSPRSLWLESSPSSQSCWWALISQYLSPTSPYRPWLPPTGVEHKTTGKQTEKQDPRQADAKRKMHAATMHQGRRLPANQCQETASHQHQLAGAGSVSRLLNPPWTAAEAGRTSPSQWCNLTKTVFSWTRRRGGLPASLLAPANS